MTESVTGSPTGASATEPFISREMPLRRQVEEQIRDARGLAGLAEEPVEQGGDLRPDAGQGVGRGEERIENGRTQ